tara:strand:+ start:267 stop:980 length:714 start_codon:yes stop_codon:yes gene_type:complete
MAIKIGGTTVIDDARELANIASLDATTIATLAASLGTIMNNIDTFTASGTFVVPAGVTLLSVAVVGGGAGGTKYDYGNDGAELFGSSAGRGGVSYSNITVTPGASLSVVVGSGGVGSTATISGAGGNGGDSTFQGQTGGGGLTTGSNGSATRGIALYLVPAFASCTAEVQDPIFTAAYKTTTRVTGQGSASTTYSAGGLYVPGAGGEAGGRRTDNDNTPAYDYDGTGGVAGAVFIIY